MRKAMAFPVRFVAEGQTVQTTSRDLDEESVFVRCVEPPAVGERVALRLYLPGLATADAIAGTVSETLEDGFRARFDPVDEEQTAHIRAVLETGDAQPVAVDPIRRNVFENRRCLPRYLDRFRVTLGVGQHSAQREALNLSASGLFIETEAPPDVDKIVHVILELPDGKPPAEAQAIVLHREIPGRAATPGAGVQFVGASDEFRQRLDAYLARLKASGSRPSR